MKRMLLVIASLVFASLAPAQDLRAQLDALPIDPDMNSHYDFRGTPEKGWEFAPYQALFKTKTYGELRKALENLLKAVAKDPKATQSKVAREAFATARQSLLRLYYFYGDLEKGDALMAEFHPTYGVAAEKADAQLEAEGEMERIRRVTEEIEMEYKTTLNKPAYPNGPPRNYQDLYAAWSRYFQTWLGDDDTPLKLNLDSIVPKK